MNLRLHVAALLALASGLFAETPPAPNAAAVALHAFFDQEWEYTLTQSPAMASMLGDRRANDRWDDVSLAAIEKRIAHTREALDRLHKIDRGQLNAADQLNYDLFEQQAKLDQEEAKFRGFLIPLTQREGLQLADEIADALRFETVKDYEDWIARLRGFGTFADQTMALMKEGARAKVVQPKVTMERVPKQIEKQLVSVPEESPFYKPLKQFPANIAEADQARLRRAAREAIEEVVLPAYRRFHAFFTSEYLPACFDEVGAWQRPQGAEFYSFVTRRFTTTQLTPRQIHEIGLSEVKRIRGEMEKVKATAGFGGTLEEFFVFLRTDRQFFCETPAALLAEYRALSRTIDPRLVRLFRTLPRMPYGIDPIPDNSAPDTTTAYYRKPAADGSRAGTFFVNLYRPETRPRWERALRRG